MKTYQILGSEGWSVDENTNVYDALGNNVIYDGLVPVVLHGVGVRLDPRWLYLYAYYGYNIKGDDLNRLDDIEFIPVPNIKQRKVRCGYLPRHKRPFYVFKEYRIVPDFPKFSISQDSVVVKTETGECVKNMVRGYRIFGHRP